MAISQSDKIWLLLDDRLIEGAPEDLMIAGAFDHLFDSSTVIFNSDNGTFSFRSENRGTIYLDGKNSKRYWTEKAINRAGFSVSNEMTSTYIILPSESNSKWQLSAKSIVREFKSIHELITCLDKEVMST